jgi:hypothetical protein
MDRLPRRIMRGEHPFSPVASDASVQVPRQDVAGQVQGVKVHRHLIAALD